MNKKKEKIILGKWSQIIIWRDKLLPVWIKDGIPRYPIDQLISFPAEVKQQNLGQQKGKGDSDKLPTAQAIQKLYIKLGCILWFCSLNFPLFIISQYITNRNLLNLILLFTGWFIWTFSEYWLHRFSMHDPDTYKKPDDRHAHHHQHPSDISITPIQRTLLGCIVLVATVVAWRSNSYFILLGGFAIGMLGYSCMHWVLHQSWAQKLFPSLIHFHIQHHCKHPDKCFGISVTWWDYLFDTVPNDHSTISHKVISFYFNKKHS